VLRVPRETLPDLSTYLEDGNNPDEPGWFLQWLQKRGAVHAYTFDGAWFDIGTADSYLDAVEYALDGGTLVADDAIVENSDPATWSTSCRAPPSPTRRSNAPSSSRT